MTVQARGGCPPVLTHRFVVHFLLLFVTRRTGDFLMRDIQSKRSGVVVETAGFPARAGMTRGTIPVPVRRALELPIVRVLRSMTPVTPPGGPGEYGSGSRTSAGRPVTLQAGNRCVLVRSVEFEFRP